MKKIELSGNASVGNFVLVDDEDYSELSKYKWKLQKGYATRNAWIKSEKRYRCLSMHRVVTNAPRNLEVDHKNRNRLDNRKANLRLCTTAQNRKNTPLRKDNKTGYKGVFLESRNGKYYAQITLNRVVKHLGTFDTALQAYDKYKEEAKKLHGEFANV